MRKLLLISICLTTLYVAAQRINSVTKGLKARHADTPVATAPCGPSDTVSADTGMVRFYGYEKTLRTNRETLFATNLCNREVNCIIFTVSYSDVDGKLLHRRQVTVHQDIPPGETRRIDFPTWDRQMTFYYRRSPRPRVPAIPYDVTIAADTLLLATQK